MQQAGTWDRARERAGALIGSVNGADRAMLVAADHRMRVLQEPVFAADTAQPAGAARDSSRARLLRVSTTAPDGGSGAWGAGPGERSGRT